ncbi:GNAT family N-acetyltransferase [Aestuariivirga sp.]|uniref:GNAT family N-acetyltransferase n=1 Tax=Aestuariivirga sp. TaxID=2650926 RepID=UPI003BA85421
MRGVVIRDLSGMDDFFKAEQLQRDVWGADDTEDPADLMMVIQHEGGLAAGAFEGERLLGYVFAFPTREPHVQHSHRLAVHPEARGRSLALALKRYQREWCLARGISLVRWTFDPLRHTNAHLNIARLGAEVSTYHRDYYGVMKGINAGLPSDRLLADWHLHGTRAQICAGWEPGQPKPPLPDDAIRVEIPPDLDRLLLEDEKAALAWRFRVRDALTRHFAEGHAIRFFDADTRAYLLTPAA